MLNQSQYYFALVTSSLCQALVAGGRIMVRDDPWLESSRTYRRYFIAGVPRILEGTLPPHFSSSGRDTAVDPDWLLYEEYLRTTRININARQVFPKGFDPRLPT